jgi:hypothetical protein
MDSNRIMHISSNSMCNVQLLQQHWLATASCTLPQQQHMQRLQQQMVSNSIMQFSTATARAAPATADG